MSALIWGHSFVRRMEVFLRSAPLSLHEQFSYVFFQGKPGAKLGDLYESTDFIQTTDPRVLLLDIGFNDLTDPGIDPYRFATDLIAQAGKILFSSPNSIQCIVVMQIFHRGSAWQPGPGQRSMAEFNQAVDLANYYLKVESRHLSGIKFFQVRKMSLNFEQYLTDGVHFNALGMKKYRTNYRGALLEGYKLSKWD